MTTPTRATKKAKKRTHTNNVDPTYKPKRRNERKIKLLTKKKTATARNKSPQFTEVRSSKTVEDNTQNMFIKNPFSSRISLLPVDRYSINFIMLDYNIPTYLVVYAKTNVSNAHDRFVMAL